MDLYVETANARFKLPDNCSEADLELIEEIRRFDARESFWEFRRLINPKLIVGWWQQEVANQLQQFYQDYIDGKRPKLLLQSPPQHGKSTQVVDFLAWLSGHLPDTKIIFGSFSDRLGIRANLRLQRIYETPAFKKTFPRMRLKTNAGAVMATRNREILEFIGYDGYFRNTTVMGAVTGEGLDIGVIDDPIKGRAEASSQVLRDRTWDWLTDDFMTRFSDQAGLLLIMTRWHVDDPAGRIIENFPDARVLRYPAIAERNEKNRKAGEPLFPEFKSLEFLQQQRKPMTQAGWESVYQQHPIIVGGGMFPIDKIKVINVMPIKSDVKASVRAWDKACLVAGTLVTTPYGKIPIEQMQKGDEVLTRSGFRQVVRAWMTKKSRSLTTVIFSNGATITGTPDHKIYVRPGYWIDLCDVSGYSSCLHNAEVSQCEKSVFFKAGNIFGTLWRKALQSVATFTATSGMASAMLPDPSIGISGKRATDVFPTAVISTTRTKTGITTQSKILNVLRPRSIAGITHLISRLKLLWQIRSIERNHLKLFSPSWRSPSDMFALRVANHSRRAVSRRSIAGGLNAYVLDGEPLTSVPVYDLTVEGEHEFFANGILVHNSTEGGGAYTAGVLMHHLKDGSYLISDVRRGQWGTFERETRIKQTVESDNSDGWKVDTWIEQEPGSGGKESAQRTIMNLAGFNIRADKVKGNKELRAEPLSAQVQAGNVLILAGKFNNPLLDEMETFPNGTYKDQVDAAGMAFAKLTRIERSQNLTGLGLPIFKDRDEYDVNNR